MESGNTRRVVLSQVILDDTCERLVFGGNFGEDTEEEHLARYRYAAGFVKGRTVVDVACGSGYGSHMLAMAGAASVVGIDKSASAVAYAATNYIAENLSYETGDAEHLINIRDNSVDVVISFETIEHLIDTRSYISEIARILKSDGLYIVSTPDRRLASTLYPLRGRPNNPFHTIEFTEYQFRERLCSEFEILDFLGQNFIVKYRVFWPIQIAVKAACYAFARFGGGKIVRHIYHIGSGFDVLPAHLFRHHVARFWVARCRKKIVLRMDDGRIK